MVLSIDWFDAMELTADISPNLCCLFSTDLLANQSILAAWIRIFRCSELTEPASAPLFSLASAPLMPTLFSTFVLRSARTFDMGGTASAAEASWSRSSSSFLRLAFSLDMTSRAFFKLSISASILANFLRRSLHSEALTEASLFKRSTSASACIRVSCSSFSRVMTAPSS